MDFTGKGDQGESNLFDGRRFSKAEMVFELIGALDEASAFLGMAISLCKKKEIKDDLRKIQDQLSKLMGIIAGVKMSENEKIGFFSGVVVWFEGKIKDYGNPNENSRGFIFAGKSTLGAAIDISRTVIRRAERCAVRHFEARKDDGKEVITYLNRLSSLLFVMRLFTDLQ